ncbi:MAG: sugar phosphate nucleotidyltransferase [Lentisphaeraceae bacterium]|nr:sugar phosphate nucleotidyltransferase [Lentisphaeraceae bacterium]
MKDLTLLVMAAGMGSRYGGLKQLDSVGPSGETIIDYSVYDAIRAGFNKVVFIIRKDFEKEFKDNVGAKYTDKIKVEYAFQDLHDLPEGFTCPEGREKPWGTGQAILVAKKLINEPFLVINGDDFYGEQSFKVAADYYSQDKDDFSMVAFRLDKTLSEFGGVTRGLCEISDGKLSTIVETGDLKKESENNVTCDRDIQLNGSEPVSMNMWGYTPRLFGYLDEQFIDFLKKEGNEMKSEYLIPTVVNNLINSKTEHVTVLQSDAQWFGVTYKDDKPFVVSKIKELTDNGTYPNPLF